MKVSLTRAFLIQFGIGGVLFLFSFGGVIGISVWISEESARRGYPRDMNETVSACKGDCMDAGATDFTLKITSLRGGVCTCVGSVESK